MMKKTLDGPAFVFAFVGVELLIFFSIYVLHALMFKSLTLPDSLVRGGYEVFWRFMSLQIFMQVILMFILLRVGISRELVILISALTAYSAACIIAFSEVSAVWSLMRLPTKEAVGEGFAIVVSVISALALFRIVSMVKYS